MSFTNSELGSISASVELNLAPLKANAEETRAILASMTTTLQSQVAAMETQLAQSAAKAVADANKAAAQAAEQASAKAKQSLNTISNTMIGIGGATMAALGEAVKAGSEFEAKMVSVANNTTMTAHDIQTMRDAVSSLGRETGADLSQLAEGFAHIENMAFDASDSTLILEHATRAAVATETNAADTAEILAKTLHEFGLGADFAGRAMNTLHLAAALGNMTLQQFDRAAGPVFAWASNLGVSLVDAAAGMSALTRHGLDASEAATQLKDVIAHIVNPAKGAREELERLSKQTGIDLVHDFSIAGLNAKGLGGVLDDVKRATAAHREEVFKLVPALRGALGAYILTGTGVKDLKEITDQLTAAYKGEADPVTEGYARTQATLTAEVNRAKNALALMNSDIANTLLPTMKGMVGGVKDAADWFHNLSPAARNAALGVGAVTASVVLLTGTALKAITVIAELRTALLTLGLVGGAGGLAEAGVARFLGAAGPVGIGAMLLGGGMQLGNMMNNTVWSGVQEAQNKAFAENLAAKEKTPAYLKARVQFLQGDLAGLDRSLKDYEGVPTKIKQVNARIIEERAEMYRLMENAPPLPDVGGGVSKPIGGAGGGIASGGGGGGGKSDAASRAEELRDRIQQVKDKLFDLSHSDYEQRMRDAWRELNDEIRAGVPALLARQLYTAQTTQLTKEHLDQLRAQQGGTMAQQVESDRSVQEMERQARLLPQEKLDAITDAVERRVKAEQENEQSLQRQDQLEKEKLQDIQEATNKMVEQYSLQMEHMEEVRREAKEYAEQEAEIESNAAQYAFESGFMSYQTYKAFLQRKLEAYRAYSSEWMAITRKIEELEKNHDQAEKDKKANTPHARMVEAGKKALQQMAGNVQNILGNAFEKLFMGDSKHWFSDLLKAFQQMLAQMVAQALAAGIVRSIFGAAAGGGGFLSGALGIFGFDDADNDRKAQRWGFDFAEHFSRGQANFQNYSAPSHSASGAQSASPIVVQMTGDNHYHNDMDAGRVADIVAVKVQQRLRGVYVGG